MVRYLEPLQPFPALLLFIGSQREKMGVTPNSGESFPVLIQDLLLILVQCRLLLHFLSAVRLSYPPPDIRTKAFFFSSHVV